MRADLSTATRAGIAGALLLALGVILFPDRLDGAGRLQGAARRLLRHAVLHADDRQLLHDLQPPWNIGRRIVNSVVVSLTTVAIASRPRCSRPTPSRASSSCSSGGCSSSSSPRSSSPRGGGHPAVLPDVPRPRPARHADGPRDRQPRHRHAFRRLDAQGVLRRRAGGMRRGRADRRRVAARHRAHGHRAHGLAGIIVSSVFCFILACGTSSSSL